MRRWLTMLVLIGLPVAGLAQVDGADDLLARAPVPLAEAIRDFAAEFGRWAYTQHFVDTDLKGKVKEDQILRHDPSQHYDVQWTLLKKDGQDPTESQQKKFRRGMAKHAKNRLTLGELLSWDQAKVVAESADVLTYEVPLRQTKEQRFPPEKFQVFVELDRAGAKPALKRIDLKLRESLRVAGVLKVKSGEAHLEFVRILPDHGPAVSRIAMSGSGSIFMVTVGTDAVATRTDIRRVTPYDERFEVKLGPLKTIDF